MPAWVMHLKVAEKINEKLKLNKDAFILGNVMADADRYVIEDFSIKVIYDISHHAKGQMVNGSARTLPDIDGFINKYKNDIKNPVVSGYLVHLLTDYYFNYLTFSKHFINYDNGQAIGLVLKDGSKYLCDKEEMRISKQGDFNRYSKYLIKYGSVKNTYISFDNVKNYYKIIEEIPYTEDDIEKIIKYLSNIEDIFISKEDELKSDNYRIYSREDLDFYMDKCTNFIYEKLKDILI